VSEEERSEAQRRGQYNKVVKPMKNVNNGFFLAYYFDVELAQFLQTPFNEVILPPLPTINPYTPLPVSRRQSGDHQGM
jgi:hypothetical protein